MLKLFLIKYKYYFLIVAAVLIVLYPLSLFIYIPKWDNVNGYLPYRYFISDFVWNGHLPLWNPFQRLGYPGYADLQSGVWNPIVWILMLFGKYTINSLIIELLSCYVFAGIGFYKLALHLFKCEKTSFILGLTYSLSGFMVGSSQLMVFLIAVTWFPWIIFYLLKVFEDFKLKHQLLTALFKALFITGASPSYSIILAYIVVGIFIYQLIITKKLKNITISGIVILISLILLILPYINSFLEFAPYFNRTDKLEYSKFLLSNPFTPISYISFLFPYGVIANTDWFNITDLSLRNGYFGIVTLVACVSSILSNWNRTKIILIISVLVSLLLSAGGETFVFEYLYHLPGFGLFRHPSMFRAFTIFASLLLSGYEFKRIISGEINVRHKVALIFILLLILIIGIWSATKTGLPELKQLIVNIFNYVEFSESSLSTHLLLNAIITLGLIALAFLVKKMFKLNLFLVLTVVCFLDLALQTRFTLPTTICYKIPQENISNFFNELPNEINQSDNYTSLSKLDETQDLIKTDGIWQNLSTYNKVLSSVGINPMRFKSFDDAKENGRLEEAISHNIIYYAEDTLSVEDIKVDYNKFSASIDNSSRVKTVILNQNYHHLWKATINGNELPIKKYKDLTMSVKIPENTSGILDFKYKSPRTLPAIILSLLAYSILCFLLIRETRKID